MPRSREFDEGALLEDAMETFWRQGFDRTSVENLVERTGVHRASLYSIYPDKRALFVAGIKRYLDVVVGDNLRRLNEYDSPGEAVRRFFLGLADAPIERLRRGCLLTNTATEIGLEDPEVAALIRSAFARMERALSERLAEARDLGQLAAGVQPRVLARLLMTVLQGIRVMSRVGVERKLLREAVNGALSAIRPAASARRTAAGRRRAKHLA